MINAIQSGFVALGRSLNDSLSKTLKVRVENPQKKVEVSGKIEVDQSITHNKLGGIILALLALKKSLKPKEEVRVSNFPKPLPFPKIPSYPKEIKVSNMIKEVSFKTVVDAIGKLREVFEKKDFSPKIEVSPPVVNVPAPIVNIPRQPTPQVNVEALDLSDLTKIIDFLNGLGPKNPLPVRLSDGKKFYKALEKMAEIYAGSSFSAFQDSTGQSAMAMLNKNFEVKVTTSETWALNNTHKTGAFTYLGEENIDGIWRVTRVEKDAEFNIMRYATSKNNPTIKNYDEAWASHESLEFDRVSEAL